MKKIIKYKYKYDDEIYYISNYNICKGKITDMFIHRYTLKIVYGVDNQFKYTGNELYDTEKEAKIALIKELIKTKKIEIKKYYEELKQLKEE